MSALSYLLLKPLSAETSILVFGRFRADQCGSVVLLHCVAPCRYVRVIFSLCFYLPPK